ncbi:acyl-CoA dehydrogenase family protein [Novosphingobium sp. FKTRR1]|uniref:acyl-CoA dehydrogenase family protein n=1 Tax=Novosphingobium sp. FKTRR1 TaxID=2879118 RepID=UPI001CF09BD1
MNLELDDDLRLLADSVSGWLAQHLPFDRRRALRGGMAQRAFWDEFQGALAVAGAGLPESLGGFGGGAPAHMVVMEAAGAALAPLPYIDSAVLVGTLLTELGGHDALGQAIAKGEALAVLAWEEAQSRGEPLSLRTTAEQGASGGWTLTGTKRAVRWAAEADTVLVTAQTTQGPAIFRLTGPLALTTYRLIDDHPAADLVLDGQPGELLAVGDAVAAALVLAVDAATAALCAEAVGLMRTLLADTIDYTRQRKQFGQTLSSFQVLQHRMVDMRMQIEQAAAAALLAALKPRDPAVISAAKTTIGDAVRFVGQQAVQLHGAMGMTEELRVGHYFRRTTAIENQFGDADRHLARYVALKVA